MCLRRESPSKFYLFRGLPETIELLMSLPEGRDVLLSFRISRVSKNEHPSKMEGLLKENWGTTQGNRHSLGGKGRETYFLVWSPEETQACPFISELLTSRSVI